jgi:hypothetical protein
MNHNKNYITQLHLLKDSIEKLDITEQIGLLHYLNNNIPNFKNEISENQNGIFINLSSVHKIFIDSLNYYLEYVLAQRKYIDSFENEKDKLKLNFTKSPNFIQNQVIKS